METKEYKAGTPIGDRIVKVQSLRAQIEALEAELDAEKAYLLGHLLRQDLKGAKCGATSVIRRERANWLYSEAIKRSEKTLKARKQREQEDGTAINNPTEHLMVTISGAVLVGQLAGVK